VTNPAIMNKITAAVPKSSDGTAIEYILNHYLEKVRLVEQMYLKENVFHFSVQFLS
jgi:hypothetical protein